MEKAQVEAKLKVQAIQHHSIYTMFKTISLAQVIMSKAAVNVRRSLGLDQVLREHLTQQSLLVHPPATSGKPGKKKTEQKQKSCLALGLCVCSDYPDAGQMFVNMVLYLRRTFWKEKKESKASGPRILLESFLLVLELQQSIPSYDSTTSSEFEDWDCFYQQQHSSRVRIQNKRVFLHIGRVDFQSWHFGAMHLRLADKPTSESDPDVCFLVPACDDLNDQQLGIYTDVQAFAFLLDLDQPCTLKLYHISLQDEDWVDAPSGSIAVRPVSGFS